MGCTFVRTGVAIFLLVLLLTHPPTAEAQIAPTNTASITGNVSNSAGTPVANATVLLTGPRNASTRTDSQGLFVFTGVPYGTYRISAAAAELGTASRAGIVVQGDINVAIQYETAAQTGLRTIASVSSKANAGFNVTAASITQVSPIQNALAGKTSWRTILEQIPGVAQAGLGNGSLLQAAYPDGPLVPVQISINGTLPYETATLLDDMPLIGKSLATGPGGGTDLSFYPLNSFDAADVVRGPGANTPSVVDSIGGSFVLHPPGVVDHNRYDLSVSSDPYGGVVANGRAAVRWKRLSAIATYGVNDSPGPINASVITPNLLYGFSGVVTVNGQTLSQYKPPCLAPACEFGQYLIDPRYSTASSPIFGYQGGLLVCCMNVSSAWAQHTGSLALHYGLSPNVSAEVFYAGDQSLTHEPAPNVVFNFQPPTGYSGPTGMSLVSSINTPDTAEQDVSSLLEEKIVAQIGRGLFRLAALQNRTAFTFGQNFSNVPMTGKLYGAGYLNGSPTVSFFNGGTYSVTSRLGDEYLANWVNNRDVSLSYVTPVGAALNVGASFVRSYYDNPSTLYFNIPSLPLHIASSTPSAISQTTDEMRVFVGGNPWTKTTLDLSTYFVRANYHVQDPNDKTGNSYVNSNYTYTAPRVGFVWRPNAAVAVRASAGGGFAEAPLADLVGSNRVPTAGSGFYSQTLTNLGLQPEKSFGFDLGSDIRLREGLVVSFDVYRTNLFGQLYNSTSLSGTYLGLPLFIKQFGNLGESRYEGMLLDVRRSPQRGLYWALSGGLTRGFVASLPAGFYNKAGLTCTPSSPANCANPNVVTGINFNGTFTNGASIPYAQGLATVGYRWSPDRSVDLVSTYFGNNNTYFRPAFVELDGHAAYALTKNVSLLVSFRNITGQYDSPYQIQTPENLSGAPTVSGLPYVLFGEEYGPRAIVVTTQVRL